MKPILPDGLMHLSKNFTTPAVNYANQGNSIIGIRDSGKTYAATKAAEQLLDNNIPIIAFDPTGIWQNLRNGINGNPGYPVVVAGGMNADLVLNEKNAIDILDAALKEKISLVMDFKGLSTTSKSKWLRIVSDCIEYLMGNNDQYGLRHVFIEEAAEFVPQRPQPGGQVAYSRIEAMARMGRNFGLGYTLINQRAEEISKAIFEISEQVMVFRQAGKNSLKSIKDWLDYRGLQRRDIVSSLPNLSSGECWIINNETETRVKILPKKTFHPDPKTRKINLPEGAKISDTTSFIKKMKNAIDKKYNVINSENIKDSHIKKGISDENAEKIKLLQNTIHKQSDIIKDLKSEVKHYHDISFNLANKLNHLHEIIKKLPIDKVIIPEFEKMPSTANFNENIDDFKNIHQNDKKPQKSSSSILCGPVSLPAGEGVTLTCIAQLSSSGCTRTQLTLITGYKRSSRDAFVSRLKTRGLIYQQADKLYATSEGIKELGPHFKALPVGKELQDHWLERLPEGERKILAICINHYPNDVSREFISDDTDYKRSSRDAFISRLAGRELITPTRPNYIKASDQLF